MSSVHVAAARTHREDLRAEDLHSHGTREVTQTSQLEMWRDILSARVKHHEKHFHRDIRETDTALDLLESIAAQAGNVRTNDDVPDVPLDATNDPTSMLMDTLAADANNSALSPEENARRQLKRMRSINEALQLAIDVLRARSHQKAFTASKSPKRKFALPGTLAEPYVQSSHAELQANIYAVLERAVHVREERVNKESNRLSRLLVSAPISELSAEIRATIDTNAELEATAVNLEATGDALECHLQLLSSEAPPFVLPVSAMFVPRDMQHWAAWADDIRRLSEAGVSQHEAQLKRRSTAAVGLICRGDEDDAKDLFSSKNTAFMDWLQLCHRTHEDALRELTKAVTEAS